MKKTTLIRADGWLFDQEAYNTDVGIDLDIDKVEQFMKPELGARFVGDVRYNGFIPVGFRDSNIVKRDVATKSKVEFKDPGVYKKYVRRTIYFLSRIEYLFFKSLKKMRF